MENKLTFTLSEDQQRKLEKWQEEIKEKYGHYGLYEYRFTPTGVCIGLDVYSSLTKTTIDLTEYGKC